MSAMRLILLPVTSLLDHPHVLLKFDFLAKVKDTSAKEYAMTVFNEPVLSSGSVATVCDIVRKNKVLRILLGIPEEDDQLESAASQAPAVAASTSPAAVSPTGRRVERALSSSESPPSSSSLSPSNRKNKLIERLIDFKSRARFFSLGENADVCVCALLVTHISCCRLNAWAEKLDQIGRHPGQIPTITRRENYYFWICLRDIRDKLIAVDKILKQNGIANVLSLVDQWMGSAAAAAAAGTRSAPSLGDNTGGDVRLLKQRFRCMVWDLMEQKQEIMYPHPCHGRIPNFRGREAAAENLAALSTFKQARVIKINPSLAQEHVRFLTLASAKVLLTPSPALESAVPFYKIDPRFLSRKQIQRASTKAGAASLGSMLSLSGLGNLHVDLVVVGSVVVNPITGARLGKGFGYADLEYAMMAQLGAVSDAGTVVATVVHESQLVNDLPDEVMGAHDLPVNLVATPKRVVFTRCSFPKPKEIIWSEVTREMFASIPALRDLYDLIEHKRRESACYCPGGADELTMLAGRKTIPTRLP